MKERLREIRNSIVFLYEGARSSSERKNLELKVQQRKEGRGRLGMKALDTFFPIKKKGTDASKNILHIISGLIIKMHTCIYIWMRIGLQKQQVHHTWLQSLHVNRGARHCPETPARSLRENNGVETWGQPLPPNDSWEHLFRKMFWTPICLAFQEVTEMLNK